MALVNVHGPKKNITVLLLMDEGSTISLIDAALAASIGLRGIRQPLELTCIGELGMSDNSSQLVNFGVSGPDSTMIHKISNARTIRNLNLGRQSLQKDDIKKYTHISNLPIEYYKNMQPSILLGQDYWNLITATQIRHTTINEPAASLTQLGWVVHGRISTIDTTQRANATLMISQSLQDHDRSTSDLELNTLVKQSFLIDSIGITAAKRKNKQEERAERLLATTTKYKGKYWEVGLLWKRDGIVMPSNKKYALNRLMSIEKKMDKDADYGKRYCSQVDHLIKSNYAKKINNLIPEHPRSWYLPHFGIVNPNKPEKLRLVFDAAAKTDGVGLNDNLLTGPDLVNSLVGVLIRFRQGRIAIKGDIREMFMQIKIRNEDQYSQMFLWREMDRNREPDVYVMTSMIFGSASSPYTAQYIMQRNALTFEQSHPLAVNAIMRKHYVDDYLDSFDTVEEAKQRIKDVSYIQNCCGFEIKDWTSNTKLALESIPTDKRTDDLVDLAVDEMSMERTLGLKWCPSTDTITFDLSLKRLPQDVITGGRNPTKREMLRIIMSIYDPLGILLPYIIRSKILLQDVWRSGIGWDEKLHDREFGCWQTWINMLDQIKNYQIERPYFGKINIPDNAELHVFSDGSEKAFAAVAYLRVICKDQTVHVSFVAGKARVAPLKPVSIPRMELQGALIASRLAKTIAEELEIKLTKRTFWTDSRTVLGWIHADPRRYQSFVAHRLGEIDELTNAQEWKWIPSKLNSSDHATKDTGTMDKLMNRWINGPEFLVSEESSWPEQPIGASIQHPETEAKKEFTGLVMERAVYEAPNIESFSNWLSLIRCTALILLSPKIWKGISKPEISVELMEKAETYLIRKVQQDCFANEIGAIKQNLTLPKNSRLKLLTLVVTKEDSILKIDGRINATNNVVNSVKNPIILDGKHHFTRLLIKHYHERFLHGSPETVVNEIKQKYWVLGLRPAVRSVTSRCYTCRIQRGKAQQPRMGDLPEARLGHHLRPFTYCGLDYFGPMIVSIGRRHEKRWGALFTCLTTRAIHLELASTLSSDSAIMALQRMSNRRGTPSEIHSDNGTNFIGMNAELKEELKKLDHTRIYEEMPNKGIKWRFIPPQTPHMGGAWERLVRSVKTALSVILKDRAPKEEILRTLLTEVEHVINSRPLTTVSVDHRDKEAITPNHWLIGSSSGAVVRGEFTDNDLYTRKQWKISQRLADMFWGRWVKEYLPNLVVRKRWTQESRNLEKGDVVLIADSTMPRNVWPKGVITSVYPGNDGRIRIVDVQSRGRVFKRAANKIIVLVPVSEGTESLDSRTGGRFVNDKRQETSNSTTRKGKRRMKRKKGRD